MVATGGVEALELGVARILELQALADAQVGDDVGDQDLARLGLGAQPGGELDGGAEQVVRLLDRLAGGDADAHDDRIVGVRRHLVARSPLDLAGAADGAAGERNAAMMPSPVCLTSRPRLSPSASRTIWSWTPSIAIAASSPWREHISVEPTMSVNMTVRTPVSRWSRLAPGTSAAPPALTTPRP